MDHQERKALRAAKATRVHLVQQGLKVCEEPLGQLVPQGSVDPLDGWVAQAGKVRTDPRVYQDLLDPRESKECRGLLDRRAKKATLESEVFLDHWVPPENPDKRAAREPMDCQALTDLMVFRAKRESLASKVSQVHLAKTVNTEGWALLDQKEKRGSLDLRGPLESVDQLVLLALRGIPDHLDFPDRMANPANKASRAPLEWTEMMESKETQDLLENQVLPAKWVFQERAGSLVQKVQLGSKGLLVRQVRRETEA